MNNPFRRKGRKILLIIDNSASMSFCPNDRVKVKFMNKQHGGGTFVDVATRIKASKYDKVFLVTDGDFCDVPLGFEKWKVKPEITKGEV